MYTFVSWPLHDDGFERVSDVQGRRARQAGAVDERPECVHQYSPTAAGRIA
jgi:hypothetical protein